MLLRRFIRKICKKHLPLLEDIIVLLKAAMLSIKSSDHGSGKFNFIVLKNTKNLPLKFPVNAFQLKLS